MCVCTETYIGRLPVAVVTTSSSSSNPPFAQNPGCDYISK